MKKENNTNTSSYDTFNRCVKNSFTSELSKKWNLMQFDWIKYVFKIWLNQSEKNSNADVQLGSKYASMSTTLNLTFLKRIKF